MIEMNVSKKNRGEVRDIESVLLKLLAKCGDCRSGTGIDQSSLILRTKQSSSNGARMTSPMEIDGSSRVHSEIQV